MIRPQGHAPPVCPVAAAQVRGLPSGGVVFVAEAQSAAHNLAGQVEDGGVIVQDEIGVGSEDDPVQLEGESAGIVVGGKFLLPDRGGSEAAEQVDELGLEVSAPAWKIRRR